MTNKKPIDKTIDKPMILFKGFDLNDSVEFMVGDKEWTEGRRR